MSLVSRPRTHGSKYSFTDRSLLRPGTSASQYALPTLHKTETEAALTYHNTAGTPEAGGWTTREVKRIIRGLAGLNFV